MAGLYFYWTAWAAWVIATFFMKKGRIRTETAALVLILIICSNRYVKLDHVEINTAFIVMLLYGYQKLAMLTRSRLIYMATVCHIVMLGYIGFSMYSMYDPAILWFDMKWMTALLIFILTQFLVKSFSLRCLTAVIGAVHGNLLYTWIMRGFSFPVKAGSFTFFDTLAICLMMIALWRGYEEIARLLNHYFKRTFQQKGHYMK